MSENFTIKQLYEFADIVSLHGIKELLKNQNLDQRNLSELLQNLIRKQAIERNKLRKKKIATLIKIYVEDGKSVSDSIDDIKNYIEDKQKIEEIKAKLLSKKENVDDGSYEILIEDIKDYLSLYDGMKTIDDIIKNIK